MNFVKEGCLKRWPFLYGIPGAVIPVVLNDGRRNHHVKGTKQTGNLVSDLYDRIVDQVLSESP